MRRIIAVANVLERRTSTLSAIVVCSVVEKVSLLYVCSCVGIGFGLESSPPGVLSLAIVVHLLLVLPLVLVKL